MYLQWVVAKYIEKDNANTTKIINSLLTTIHYLPTFYVLLYILLSLFCSLIYCTVILILFSLVNKKSNQNKSCHILTFSPFEIFLSTGQWKSEEEEEAEMESRIYQRGGVENSLFLSFSLLSLYVKMAELPSYVVGI